MTAIASMTPLLMPRPRSAGGPVQPSILDLPNVALVSQGRAAIALALREANIGAGDTVMVPAYHCPAMTAAVRAVGAVPRFFRVTENLRILPEHVFAAADHATKAVLVPHFFLVRQTDSLFRDLKENSNWLVVEDCAHSFFAHEASGHFGCYADYVIGSVPKFFPTRWGGVIGSRTRKCPTNLTRSPGAFQVKLMVNCVEEAANFDQFGIVSPLIRRSLSSLSNLRGRRQRWPESQAVPAPTKPAPAFGDVDMLRLQNRAGWWVEAHCGDVRTFAARAAGRAASFERLLHGLRGISRGRILEATESAHDFPPYVLPLILDHPARDFARLREAGVPMYRWEHSATGVCSTADWYGDALIQLPCHDTMTPHQITRICMSVRAVLK